MDIGLFVLISYVIVSTSLRPHHKPVVNLLIFSRLFIFNTLGNDRFCIQTRQNATQLARDGETVLAESATWSFRAHPAPPRWLDAPGITNARDMGGWQITSQQRIRQGLLYRPSEMSHHVAITEQGKRVLVDALCARCLPPLTDRGNSRTPAHERRPTTFVGSGKRDWTAALNDFSLPQLSFARSNHCIVNTPSASERSNRTAPPLGKYNAYCTPTIHDRQAPLTSRFISNRYSASGTARKISNRLTNKRASRRVASASPLSPKPASGRWNGTDAAPQ